MIIEKEKEADPGQVAKFGGLWRWGHQNSWQFNLRLSDQSNVFISRESQLRHRPHARCDAVRREFLSFSLLQLHCRRFPLFFFVILSFFIFSSAGGMMIVAADDDINTASLLARRWRKIQRRCASAHLPVKVPSTPRAADRFVCAGHKIAPSCCSSRVEAKIVKIGSLFT